MKSLDFFLDKAKQYVSEIDTVMKSYKNYIDAYTDPATMKMYNAQKIQIEDLELKSQLLFSEFDKGDIFNERIKASEKSKNPFAQQTETLSVYKRTLELFIDHINEFRK
jgi:hypothetical protein